MVGTYHLNIFTEIYRFKTINFESKSQINMDWETLPPFIIEKIVNYAAHAESEEKSDSWNRSTWWLWSLEKFGRVSERWRSTIIRSKKLISDGRNELSFSCGKKNTANLYDLAKGLASGGYFGLIKHLEVGFNRGNLGYFQAERILGSIAKAENFASLEEFIICIDRRWILESVNSVMRILHRCPKLTHFNIKFEDKSKCTPKWAVRLWELLLQGFSYARVFYFFQFQGLNLLLK